MKRDLTLLMLVMICMTVFRLDAQRTSGVETIMQDLNKEFGIKNGDIEYEQISKNLPCSNRMPIKHKDSEQEYEVNCSVINTNLLNDIEDFRCFAVPVLNAKYCWCDFDDEFHSIYVEAGTYDFIVHLSTKHGQYFLVKENVEINSNKTIEFDVNAATNHIEWIYLDHNGKELEQSCYDYRIDDYVKKTTLESFYSSLNFIHKEYGAFWSSTVTGYFTKIDNDGNLVNFLDMQEIYVTPSDKLLFFNYGVGRISDDGSFQIGLTADSNQTGVVKNDYTRYTKISGDMFQKSNCNWVMPEEDAPYTVDNCRYNCDYNVWNGEFLGYVNLAVKNTNTPNVTYFCPPDLNTGSDMLFVPVSLEMFEENFPFGYIMAGIEAPVVKLEADGELYHEIVSLQDKGANSSFFCVSPENFKKYANVSNHKKININKGVRFGDNAPSMIWYVTKYPSENVIVPNLYFIGRYGETRSIDSQEASTIMKFNGEEVDDITEFVWGDNGTPQGKYDIDVLNENATIDGIKAHCTAHVSYDTNKEDNEPPTLRYLQFVKGDDVTDRFETSNEGMIEFSAGDFTCVNSPNSEYDMAFEYKAIDKVKVEWAPNGTTDFTELAVAEVPELFCMPGFGAFYRGSLSSVNKMSSNGWFDLRITLTDAAGNYQEQVISPAFKVNALDAVSEVSTDGDIQVYVRDGAIVVSGVENPNIEVYNAAGSRVRTNGLTQGIYVVRVNGTAHKVFVK